MNRIILVITSIFICNVCANSTFDFSFALTCTVYKWFYVSDFCQMIDDLKHHEMCVEYGVLNLDLTENHDYFRLHFGFIMWIMISTQIIVLPLRVVVEVMLSAWDLPWAMEIGVQRDTRLYSSAIQALSSPWTWTILFVFIGFEVCRGLLEVPRKWIGQDFNPKYMDYIIKVYQKNISQMVPYTFPSKGKGRDDPLPDMICRICKVYQCELFNFPCGHIDVCSMCINFPHKGECFTCRKPVLLFVPLAKQ